MNKIYRIVWSTSASAFVVASEFAKGDSRGGARGGSPARRGRLAWSVALLLGCAHPAWAQSLHWDGTDTTADADGGNGIWDDTTANWDSAATGGADTVWSSAIPNDAVFGLGGLVTVTGAGVTVHNLNLTGTGVTFDGGSITFSGATPTIDAAGAATHVFDTVIAGSSGITKTGSGTVQFNGTNTYSGTTSINAGVLQVGIGGTLGTGDVSVASGAALALADGVALTGPTTTNLAAGATLALGAGASYGCGTGDGIFNLDGVITGAGNIDQCGGDDNLVITGQADLSLLTGTISGGTQVTQDILDIDNALALTISGSQVTGYEMLRKQLPGTATLTGDFTFPIEVEHYRGTLALAGSVTTPTLYLYNDDTTLRVDGKVSDAGDTTTFLIGDGGAATIAVSAGGELIAEGVLGNGSDTLDVAGQLSVFTGTMDLAGDADIFNVRGGANVIGTVDGGSGPIDAIDALVADIDTDATIGTSLNFETMTKDGTGTLSIRGGGTSTFGDVDVLAGTMHVAAGTFVVPMAGSTLETIVHGGATLDVAGAFGCGAGNDTLDVSGTVSGTGTKDQCDGDDTLILRDGASISGTIIDGGNAATGDTLVIDNALALDVRNVSGYETVRKLGAGTASVVSNVLFDTGIEVQAGTLAIQGSSRTPTVTMTGTSTLQVDGKLDLTGSIGTTITGDAGAQSVVVTGILLASGDLGDGADTLDVSGSLSLTIGDISLGAGNDTLIVHDGARIDGTVDGDAGIDTFNPDIAGTAGIATLGALTDFESLVKSGAGTLVLDASGPASAFESVDVQAGTLQVSGAATVLAPTGRSLDTNIAALATLDVDGTYGCGDVADTITLSGTLSGSGSVDQCAGDDTLILHDGADLSGFTGAIDGDAGTGDRVVLDNASAFGLAGSGIVRYEILAKTNTGQATLTGAHSYGDHVEVDGPLDVANASSLATPTIDLADDAVFTVRQGAIVQGVLAGDATTLAGSSGANTVVVENGATLIADGDLGDGVDVLDVAGTLDTDGGTLSLGAGDDEVRVYETSNLANATVDAGAGNDLLNINVGTGHNTQLGSTSGFESVGKSGAGTMAVDGPNVFARVEIDSGTLSITAATGSLQAQTLDLAAGATLTIGGALQGTSGADVFTLAGVVNGAGTFDLGAGDDTLTVHDMAAVAGTVAGGAGIDTFRTDIATNATLGAATGFEALDKSGAGRLQVAGPAASQFASVTVNAGTLAVGAAGTLQNVSNTQVASGATLRVDGVFGGTSGADAMDVAGTVSGTGTIALGDGDDVLTLHDGAVLGNVIDGGQPTASDSVLLDSVNALDFDASKTVNFETVRKIGAGTATVHGDAVVTTVALDQGTLAVANTLSATIFRLSDDTTLRVDGMAIGTLAGSAGVNTIQVGSGASLLTNGDLGAGADVLDVMGTLDTESGAVHLGDGDDRVVVHDTTAIVGAGGIDAGAGNDVLDVDVGAGHGVPMPALAGFESLAKHGPGALQLNATSTFEDVAVYDGRVDLAAGGRLVAHTLDVAAPAVVQLDGDFTGTAAADRVSISGTLAGNGAFSLGDGDDTLDVHAGANLAGLASPLAFGAGNDRAMFTGGPAPALRLDGGAGGNDALVFRDNALDDAAIAGLQGWERMSLENGSTLTLSTPMRGVDALALDATSALFARDGASIAGGLSNDGAVHVGAARLSIGGDYAAGPSAILHVTVSPGSNTAGGLTIAGNVTGNTPVVFSSDGSTGGSRNSILVIDSPNDVRGDGGFTVSDSPDDTLRLEGSPYAWTFGQADDNRWYLGTDAEVVVPEVAAYATLPAIGLETARASQQAIFGHLDSMRGLHGCDRGDAPKDSSKRSRGCEGVWITANGTESRVGANPGYAYSGDAYGLYVGADGTVHTDARGEVRLGGFAGLARGNYWTTGASSGPGASSDSNVRLDGPVFGMYGELRARSGAYASATLLHQDNDAQILTDDGFRQAVAGDSISLVHQLGWQLAVQDGWSLEPQVQVGVTQVHWKDAVDAGGKALDFDDDTSGHLRAALRVERALLSDAGAWRPWFTLGIEDTIGESHSAVSASEVALAGEDLGQRWTLDAGIEAALHNGWSLFGSVGVAREINGTSTETRQARVGARWDW